MRPLKIGIDIDGTLTDFVNPLIRYLTMQGIDVPDYESTHDFDLSKPWRCSHEEAVRRVNLFLASDEFKKLKPFEGVREAFEVLLPPHTGYVITARPKHVKHVTKNFFDNHLTGRCSKTYHLGTNHPNGSKITKAQKAVSLELDLFVEDHPVEAGNIAIRGIPVLMPNRPWNKNFQTPDLVTRVDSWREIVHYIKEYSS